jgi:hypothetical protein
LIACFGDFRSTVDIFSFLFPHLLFFVMHTVTHLNSITETNYRQQQQQPNHPSRSVRTQPQESEEPLATLTEYEDYEADEVERTRYQQAIEHLYNSTETVALSSVQQSELSGSSGRGTQYTDRVIFCKLSSTCFSVFGA